MPIRPVGQTSFERKTDLLVIGAGACGLCAALAARERGVDVSVLERDETPVGGTGISGGEIAAAGTAIQRARCIEDDPRHFADEILAKARGETDREMALAMARASGPTVDWLVERHRIPLTLEHVPYPGQSVLRAHALRSETEGPSGAELEGRLIEAVRRAGAELVTGAKVVDLHATSTGRVRGAAFRRGRRQERLGCRAAMLACSGFEGSDEMIRRHIPEMAGAPSFGHPGNKGDAVAWGQALGAAVADLGSYQGLGSVAWPEGVSLWMLCLVGGGFQVNTSGERFSDESRGYSEQAPEVIAQPGRIAWSIHDRHGHDLLLPFARYRDAQEAGIVKTAPSGPALAAATGLPVARLQRTLREVRAAIAGGRRDRFGRDFSSHRPLRPPYYAVRVTGAIFHSQGGLVVDERARVLRPDRRPLPNVFAGGGAARGLSGPGSWGYLSGVGLMMATTLGRLAGESAADLILGRNRLRT